MGDRTWDEWLVQEHEMIERAMDVLKKELNKLPESEPEMVTLSRAVDFLLVFGDGVHNQREENALFPLMIKNGIPEDGPIRVMLMEHDSERKLLQSMTMKIPGLLSSSLDEKSEFKKEGLDYLTVRAEHIWKENDILFKLGRQTLSDEDGRYLLSEFSRIDVESYGPEAGGKYRQMLREVEKGGKAVKRPIANLSMEQIDAIMETLPVEVTFVDAQDTVAYFNRLDKEKIFVRSRSVIGRKVQKCHPEKSVGQVQQIVDGFKNGTIDKAEFWIDFKNDKILIRYFPVRDAEGKYLGVLEVTQEIGEIQKLTGQKRLLDG